MKLSTASTAYLGESGRAYHEGKRAVPPAALPWLIRLRAGLFQPGVRAGDAVLEWGCGYGWNLAGLNCARRLGYDVAPQLGDAVRAVGLEFETDSSRLIPATFDVVICHHALEHVPDPFAVLGQLKRLVRPGGTLMLAVPFERERRYRRFDPNEPNHHLFSWNVQTLGNLLLLADWEVRSLGLRAYGYDRRAAWLAVQWGVGERGFRLIRVLLQQLFPMREIAAVARPGGAPGYQTPES